jgi:acyl-CoA thioesterase
MTAKQVAPIVLEKIHADEYRKFLGATWEGIEPGYCRVSLTVTEQMTNFHGITHGSIVFSVADLAFSAACNSHGRVAVALDMTISFLRAGQPGDHLVAEAKEVSLNNKTGLYDITVTETKSGQVVAKIQATAYRKREEIV